MSNVVVVDRHPSVRDALAKGAVALSGAALIISEDGVSALSVLRTTPVDVLVIDAGLDDGLDAVALVLAAAARQRSATVLLRSEHGPASAVQMGVGWLRHAPDDVAPLIGAVHEALSQRGEDGWGLGEMPLVRLLQVVELAFWTGAIGVRAGRRSGVVVADGGAVVHARFAEHNGDEAFERMLRLPDGTMTECDPPADFERNIGGDPHEMLESALRDWEDGGPLATVEITEDDLMEFMGVDEQRPKDSGFQLFSDEELADMALDDVMAIPIPPPKTPSGS